jgi:hypothetical protein
MGPLLDGVRAMHKVTNERRARQILALLCGRIADAHFIGWQLLEQSLRDELAQALRVAKERGLLRCG